MSFTVITDYVYKKFHFFSEQSFPVSDSAVKTQFFCNISNVMILLGLEYISTSELIFFTCSNLVYIFSQ